MYSPQPIVILRHTDVSVPQGNSCKHPIVILKDVNYRDLSAMLHFMYQGEVNIKQEDIASFLKVAETLQIKGLTTESEEVCYLDLTF